MKKQRPVRRLASELYHTPHLISPQAFSIISNYLSMRNAGMLDASPTTPDNDGDESDEPTVVDTIGIMNVHGSLTNKPMTSMCGDTGTSYAGLLDQMSDLIAAGCKTVVMDISSGGGEGYNCFQTATDLRTMADANGVSLISYVQDCACSAAYALACAADEVISHPQGNIGSIGVLTALVNNSVAMAQAGITRTFVSAGANKIPFDADGQFTETFLAGLQDQVDTIYDQFCQHVSTYTGLSVADVKATEASTYMAPEALEMGLINGIMTNSEFATYLQNRSALEGLI